VTSSQVTRSQQYSGAGIACMNAAGSMPAAFDRAIHDHAGRVKPSCPKLPHDPGDLRRGQAADDEHRGDRCPLRRGQHHLDRPGQHPQAGADAAGIGNLQLCACGTGQRLPDQLGLAAPAAAEGRQRGRQKPVTADRNPLQDRPFAEAWRERPSISR
jgi:hypothetical protein